MASYNGLGRPKPGLVRSRSGGTIMSAQAIEQLVDRALSDEAFAARLRTDLAGAMAEYGLTAEEQAAFASRDTRVYARHGQEWAPAP